MQPYYQIGWSNEWAAFPYIDERRCQTLLEAKGLLEGHKSANSVFEVHPSDYGTHRDYVKLRHRVDRNG
jgi:hypothetical protein